MLYEVITQSFNRFCKTVIVHIGSTQIIKSPYRKIIVTYYVFQIWYRLSLINISFCIANTYSVIYINILLVGSVHYKIVFKSKLKIVIV